MTMMFFLGLGAAHLAIAIAAYLLDGWYRWSKDFSDEDDFVLAIIFWPIIMPIFLLWNLKDKIEKARKTYDVKEQEKGKIRVQVEKEVAIQLAALEEELISDSTKKSIHR
jgi:hypothetical protein